MQPTMAKCIKLKRSHACMLESNCVAVYKKAGGKEAILSLLIGQRDTEYRFDSFRVDAEILKLYL